MDAFPQVGQIFDQRYGLLEVLGAGGLGRVFKARQIDCNRIIALKILYSDDHDDEESQKRFLREAQALNRLSHPSVVTIYHIGSSDTGFAYIAMELVKGSSLRGLLNDLGRLDIVRATNITIKLANALQHVHAHGVVHRDIKPENIIVSNVPEPDSVKIVDFGLARLEDNQKLTGTGMLIGTASYMSPEQCMGKRADTRSDIYSLCLCFYEMITGEKAFSADTPVGLMYKHINDPVPEINLRKGNNSTIILNQLISTGLAKDPEKRFQSMDEFAIGLNQLKDGEPSLAGTTINMNSNRSRVLLALTVGLIVVLPCIWLAQSYHQRGNRTVEKRVTDYSNAIGAKQKIISRTLLRMEKAFWRLPPEKRLDSGRRLMADIFELAHSQIKVKDFAAAEETLERFRKIAKDLDQNSNAYEVVLNVEIAQCKIKTGNYAAAAKLLEATRRSCTRIPDGPRISLVLAEVQVLICLRNYTEAQQQLHEISDLIYRLATEEYTLAIRFSDTVPPDLQKVQSVIPLLLVQNPTTLDDKVALLNLINEFLTLLKHDDSSQTYKLRNFALKLYEQVPTDYPKFKELRKITLEHMHSVDRSHL